MMGLYMVWGVGGVDLVEALEKKARSALKQTAVLTVMVEQIVVVGKGIPLEMGVWVMETFVVVVVRMARIGRQAMVNELVGFAVESMAAMERVAHALMNTSVGLVEVWLVLVKAIRG